MTETLVNEALALEDFLVKEIKPTRKLVTQLNGIYAEIHRVRSGGRKTPRKVAIKMGAGYVNFIRGEQNNG